MRRFGRNILQWSKIKTKSTKFTQWRLLNTWIGLVLSQMLLATHDNPVAHGRSHDQQYHKWLAMSLTACEVNHCLLAKTGLFFDIILIVISFYLHFLLAKTWLFGQYFNYSFIWLVSGAVEVCLMLLKRMTVTQVREAREGHPLLLLQQVIFSGDQSFIPLLHSLHRIPSIWTHCVQRSIQCKCISVCIPLW